MRSKEFSRLSLIQGERRSSRRGESADARKAVLHVEGERPVPVVIHMVDLGSFGLLSQSPIASNNGAVDIEVKRDDETVINGRWCLVSKRAQEKGIFYIFEHPLAVVIKDNLGSAAPDTFLRSNRYRILDSSNLNELSLVSEHFTEIKDFILPVKAVIKINEKKFQGTFDFSSSRKLFDVLEFKISSAKESFAANDRVSVEYTHLGVKYTFSSTVDSYDNSFELLSIKFSPYLIAITARRFDRHECDFHVGVTSYSSNSEGRLCQLSPSGGLILCNERFLNQTKLQLKFSIIEEVINAFVIHCGDSQIGIRFENDETTRRGLHKLFILSLPKSVVPRSVENYESFADLYGQVGYKPVCENENKTWLDETYKSWKYQDELLPGNCTGGSDTSGKLISSAGTLPLSSQVAYGHSFCMLKTAEAAAAFFEQTLHSLAVAELLPGIKYYAGSYSKKSKFTTRLHVIFESCARPDRQNIIHGLSVAVSKKPKSVENPKICIEVIKDFSDVVISPSVNHVLSLLSKPHKMFENVHSISSYKLSFFGDPVPSAILLKSSAWKTFTAAGMFNIVWVFILDKNVDIPNLVSCIQSESRFSDIPLELVDVDGLNLKIDSVSIENSCPVFWSFTDKDDFGPVIASVCRAVYSVIKKYGDQGLLDCLRVS